MKLNYNKEWGIYNIREHGISARAKATFRHSIRKINEVAKRQMMPIRSAK